MFAHEWMTSPQNSLSPAESSMDHDLSSSHPTPQTLITNPNKRPRRITTVAAAADSDSFSGEVWRNFTDSFREVQSILDRNRALIQQVNENHQSKIHDNMVKNVGLIQEINGNITKVKLLYSELSSSFSGVLRSGQDGAGGGNDAEEWGDFDKYVDRIILCVSEFVFVIYEFFELMLLLLLV